MKTNRILMLAAIAAMALVSCTPDEPVVPVTDGDVNIAEQNGLQLEGTVWLAVYEFDIQVQNMTHHFKQELTYKFFTADSGVHMVKAIIVGGYPAEEVYGEDYVGDTIGTFHYTVVDNSLFVDLSDGQQRNLYYNAANNTLVDTDEGTSRVVYHQVRD